MEGNQMSEKSWKLSPSDFAFLWEECKRCFYLKVKMGFIRPRSIMPKIFIKIDGLMKKKYADQRTESIASGLPNGKVLSGEKWIQSEIISRPSGSCYIVGKPDTLLEFDDGTFGIIDFKTSETKPEHVSLYGRQLHAYAYALENNAVGKPHYKPISKLGLLVYEPSMLYVNENGIVSLQGSMDWIEITRDDNSFMSFLDEMLSVLNQSTPPGGSPACEWCQYRDTSRRTGL
jgi:hypothetical protein